MKTQNCFTGKILRRISLSILAIMISTGMFAQKSLNSVEFKQYASELFQSTGEITFAINSVKEKRAFYEEDVLLEKWMIDLGHWVEKMDSFASSETEEINNEELIIEEKLELENWMADLKEWKCPEKEIFTEEEMYLELWMYNLKCFMDKNPVEGKKGK